MEILHHCPRGQDRPRVDKKETAVQVTSLEHYINHSIHIYARLAICEISRTDRWIPEAVINWRIEMDATWKNWQTFKTFSYIFWRNPEKRITVDSSSQRNHLINSFLPKL